MKVHWKPGKWPANLYYSHEVLRITFRFVSHILKPVKKQQVKKLLVTSKQYSNVHKKPWLNQ